MKKGKWTSRLACIGLVGVTVVGVALAAGSQGSQSDPLVTLSYLNETALPAIMKQVDEKLAEREQAFTKQLQEGGSQAVFTVVELAAGKSVILSAGSQVLLRTGAAVGSGLMDLTDGAALGGALPANHLCLAVADSQTVTASEKTTLMIQGSYK